MCTVSETLRTIHNEHAFVIYKYVDMLNDATFQSPIMPSMRGFDNKLLLTQYKINKLQRGSELIYRIGEITESPDGPGIMGYYTKTLYDFALALQEDVFDITNNTIIEAIVPVGALVRWAHTAYDIIPHVIATDLLLPVRMLTEDDLQRTYNATIS